MINENIMQNSSVEPNGSLFSSSAISEQIITHLKNLRYSDGSRYPDKSLKSMLNCGKFYGKMMAICDCQTKLISLSHHCNLRTCPTCSQTRKKRIRKAYLPILEKFNTNRYALEHLYFLTISPANYSNLEEGLKDIRRSFKLFLRDKYVKERIKGGISIIETTNNGNGWHIHIHAIIFGKRLDNRIRGKCNDCHQNLIRKDYKNQRYYCANSNCNSLNVTYAQNSKIVQIFNRCAKRDSNINITSLNSHAHVLNYLLKYVSINDISTDNPNYLAEYMFYTRKQKLITKFGEFTLEFKSVKITHFCNNCKSSIKFIFDLEVVSRFEVNQEENQNNPYPPKFSWQ